MRAVSAVLSVLLSLMPFVVLITMTNYSRLPIYVFMGITVVLGIMGLIRGRGLGKAGLFSAFSTMALTLLSMGYIPYTAHVALGTINETTLKWLALAISLSIYAYFLGNVYESSNRLAKRMRELGYGVEGLRELDLMNAIVIGVGAIAVGASLALTLLMDALRMMILAPFTALLMFIIIYLVIVIVARTHGGG